MIKQNTVDNVVCLTSARVCIFVQNHKLVASICQKASGSLPKDLSKSSLDSHSCKRGATNCCCMSQSSLKEASRDSKKQRMGNSSQTKASYLFPASPWLDKYHTLFFSYPNYHLVICWQLQSNQAQVSLWCSDILVTQVRSERSPQTLECRN